MRRRMTPPEVKLWCALRRRAQGARFRRQHPAGPYVLDFYCAAARLAIEVDGATHWRGDAEARDAIRDSWLAEAGIDTLRLSAGLVMRDLDTALRMIETAVEGR